MGEIFLKGVTVMYPTLKLYPTPGDFLRDNAAFLERYEAATQLSQGNAMGHADEPCAPGLLFGRYEAEGEPILLFGNTRPWNICLNASHEHADMSLEAVKMLAAHLKENSIEISGVTASESLCQAFMEAYGGGFQLRSAMDIMVLDELIEPRPCDGAVRKAAETDLDTVVDWMCRFHLEALNETPDDAGIHERYSGRISAGDIWMLEAPDGTPAAMAGIARKLAHGVSVNAVYTLPEYRGRAYAQNVVAQICREKLNEGNRYCTLFVDKKNPLSNRAYKKIGFKILEDCSEYKLP